jgi:hypothetical protein
VSSDFKLIVGSKVQDQQAPEEFRAVVETRRAFIDAVCTFCLYVIGKEFQF